MPFGIPCQDTWQSDLNPRIPCSAYSEAAATFGIVSSAFQRPVRLVPVGSPPPYTLVVGIGPATGLTQVPSGITY